MITIVFAHSSYECKRKGKCIDFSEKSTEIDKKQHLEKVEITTLFNRFGKDWFEEFSVWMGKLNCTHADLFWWAHTATAKNLLSSRLGQHYFQVQAVCEIARKEETNVLYVLGATPGQMITIADFLSGGDYEFNGSAWHLRFLNKWVKNYLSILKAIFQICSVLGSFFWHKTLKPASNPDLCLFTYVDGMRREGVDNYFGKLAELLRENGKFHSIAYLNYVYKPYRYRLKQLLKEQNEVPYFVLYGLLKIKDYLWIFYHIIHEWWFNAGTKKSRYQGANEYDSILQEVYICEISGYLHNLLVYKAMCCFLKSHTPKVIVYPYENKSLEKMIILSVKNSQHKIKVIGYQHTSVTPRHSSLLFGQEEATHTPFPDKIITVGKVTKEYLEKFGNYPSEIFTVGGALRQIWSERFPRQNTQNLRVLLALSSSKNELIRSIEFFKEVMEHIPILELGIRPHINFPFTLLPVGLKVWLSKNGLDLSNTLLQDNLKWCNLTAYVSSTVALESLMRGKPVVNFSVGDIVSSDPLLGEAPFRWVANTPLEMANIIMKIHLMPMRDYERYSLKAVEYVKDYLSPINRLFLENFSAVSS